MKKECDINMVECKVLDESLDNELFEMVRKNWMSHDARWQMAVVNEFGWELGNKLNQDVIKQMAKTMIYRYLKFTKITKLENIEEFVKIWNQVVDLFWPSHENYKFFINSPTEIQVIISKCPVYDSVRTAGVADKYECACNDFREGLFSALGLEFTQGISKCLINGDDICEINVSLAHPF